MESLSKSLQPYKDVVGQVAGIVTIAQFFSGAVVCRDIYKKGTTEGTPATPFIGGVALGILFLKQGFLLNDYITIQVNVVAIFLNLIYTIFYYVYCKDRYKEFYRPLAVGGAIVAIFLGYAEMEHPDHVETRFGIILTILMLSLLGSPLADVKGIIEKKDASSIPVPITFMAALTTFLWLVYGIILMNAFLVFQNVVGFSLCLLQLILVVLYPGPANDGKIKKRTKKD